MKRTVCLVLLVLIAILYIACGESEESSRASGKGKLPKFEVKLLSGGTLKSKDLKGSVVVIDFWATWCRPCLMEIPFYNELHREYGDKKLIILGVVMDFEGERAMKRFVRRYGITYRVGIGTEKIARDFGGVRSVPTTFVIDPKGNIQEKIVGFSSAKEKQIRRLTEQFL